MSPRTSTQKGFTIIELMISTAVFSTILIVVLTAVTQIARIYYKGITTAKTQETARILIDRISQEIQYSPAATIPTYVTDGTKNVRCIGNSRFFYVLNQKKTSTNYGLWSDDSAAGSNACTTATDLSNLFIPTGPPAVNFRELLPEKMRIVKFDISGIGNLYTVTIRVLYGDDDLIDVPGGDVSQSTCKGSTVGTQFCGISELSVTVNKRL